MDDINNEENLKIQERKAKRAQDLLNMARLPPRMEMH